MMDQTQPVLRRSPLQTVALTLCWLALFTALLHVYANLASGKFPWIWLYNSDSLFIPAFYHDLITSGSISGWDFPTSPYLFPDIVTFIPLYALIRNVHLVKVLFGALQVLIFVAGLSHIHRRLSGFASPAHFAILPAATLYLLLLAPGRQIMLFYPLVSLHHFGVMVVLPFFLLLVFRYLKTNQSGNLLRRDLALLILLSFLTSLSDLLFIVQVIAPVIIATLAASLLSQANLRRTLLLNVALLLSATVGQLLRSFIGGSEKMALVYANSGIQELNSTTADLAVILELTQRSDPLLVYFWLLSILCLLIAATFSTVRAVAKVRTAEPNGSAELTFLYHIFLVVTAVSSLLAAVFTGNSATRYLMPLILLPLVTGIPALLMYLRPHTAVPFAASALALLSMGFVASNSTLGNLPALVDYQDPFVTCMQTETARRNLRNGLGNYWYAISSNVLSQHTLNIVQVSADLSPFLWNNNRRWYEAPFDYVVVDGNSIRKEYVSQKLGKAAESFECDGRLIYVYNRPIDVRIQKLFKGDPRLARFSHVGVEAEFFGYTLPTDIGGVPIGLSQAASDSWGNNAGVLAYAPLSNLPAGRYYYEIHTYASNSGVGSWAIAQTDEESPQIIQTGEVAHPGKNVNSGFFSLSTTVDLQISVVYLGGGTLFADKIRLKRVADDVMEPPTFEKAPVPSDTPALTLLHPHDRSFIEERIIDFAWQWTGPPLTKDQAFEVRVWHKDDPYHFGAHDVTLSPTLIRQIDDTYIMRLDLNGAYSVLQHGANDYLWSVGIVAVQPAYQDLQIEASPQEFYLLE